MENIKILGTSEIFTLSSKGLEPQQKVHLAKGTKVYAYGGYMAKQEFVIYDDNMNAVEICKGDSNDIDEGDLERYFSPKHKVDETVRPISKKFGIGFYYDESGELISDDIIKKSLERAEKLEDLRVKVKQRKEQEEDDLKSKLIAEYPYLTVVKGYDHKVCGHNIRTELKKKFSGVKFSVRYENCDTYHISWTDGPASSEVEDVISKYQDHHSDYSGDYWDYNPSVFNKLFGGAKYITSHRTISETAKASIREEYKDLTNENLQDYKYKEADKETAMSCIRYYTTITADMIIDAIARKRSYNTKPVCSEKQSKAGLQMIDYSERAIVVIGDTKSIKDELKQLGGRFNARLNCGPGWVFSKSKLDVIKEFLKNN